MPENRPPSARPAATVVIPTYNRAELLRDTLTRLTAQTLPAGSFEVVVADDGSTDATREVVDSFTDRLTIGYHYQEDRGFRAGLARNAGAAMATAPLLLFLDCGALPGCDYLERHLAHHRDPADRKVVLGYMYAFNPVRSFPGLRAEIAAGPLEELVERRRDEPAFADLRHQELAEIGFDLSRMAVPWMFCFSANLSLRTDDFRAVGGFDETFTGWGCEDMDLGIRLLRAGLRFTAGRDCWTVESPHDRDTAANFASFRRNMGRLHDKFPEPAVEIGWSCIRAGAMSDWEPGARELAEHTERVRELPVEDELARALAGLPATARVAVLGCGGRLPANAEGRDLVLLDFDAELLARAADGTPLPAHHCLGARTPLPDSSVDVVVATSRLAALWPRWGAPLLAEAARIRRSAPGSPAGAGPAGQEPLLRMFEEASAPAARAGS
jgi:glycosyltransferase involved in cell wall biosynthesis